MKKYPQDYSDEELIGGCKDKHFEIFEELVRRYGPQLYRFVYRLIKDKGESEDIVQETFLRVYQNREKFNPKYPFKAWLYSIVTHLSINMLNSARRKRLVSFCNRGDKDKTNCPSEEILEEEIEDTKKNPEETFQYRQTSQRLNHAIECLNPRQKAALILNKIEGLSYQEIAGIMKLSVSSVESLIFRAKQKLISLLEEKNKLQK